MCIRDRVGEADVDELDPLILDVREDVRFTDLPGMQHHFNVPASSVDEDFFVTGQLFDGSSIRGFAGIAESDMQLIPDVATAFVDPFRVRKTLTMNFSIVNPRTGEPYLRDPRGVAQRAEAYLSSSGIADTAFFAPEAEFFIFEDVRYESSPRGSFYAVDSDEAWWNASREDEGGNLSHKTGLKGGYFPVSPTCLLYTSPSPRDGLLSRMPSSA